MIALGTAQAAPCLRASSAAPGGNRAGQLKRGSRSTAAVAVDVRVGSPMQCPWVGWS
ncbi:hypothetical protein D516_0211 [Rhodobacter sp. AKP1]|nr:hypothetical protein D516_0211 [Rhodobacter sp. AKP1]